MFFNISRGRGMTSSFYRWTSRSFAAVFAISCLLVICCPWDSSALVQTPTVRKNVVFIMTESFRLSDTDLNWVETPNLRRLQKTSFVFKNAFSQFPQAGPSRNSLLTGRYPQTTLAYNNNDGYRTQRDLKWATLPGFFRDVLNYSTVTVGGRVFFQNPGYARDLSRSWTGSFYRDTNANNHCLLDWLQTANGEPDRIRRMIQKDPYYMISAGKICVEKNSSGVFSDLLLADAAVTELKRLGALRKPFFMGVTLDSASVTHHVREQAMKKNLQKRQMDGPNGPIGLFPKGGILDTQNISWLDCNYIQTAEWSNKMLQALNDSSKYLPHPVYPPDLTPGADSVNVYFPTRLYRAAYYSSMEIVDEAVGKIMNALQKDVPEDVRSNTIVVLFSDQGYKLGEHRLWCVRCLFDSDLQTRVMIQDPSKPKSLGKIGAGLFDLVDLYPTVVSLATEGQGVYFTAGLEGKDHSEILRNPKKWAGKTGPREYSFSQVSRCNVTLESFQFDATRLPLPDWSNFNVMLPVDGTNDGCNRKHRYNISYMGYSVRSRKYRLVTYLNFDGLANTPSGGKDFAVDHPVVEELYDHNPKSNPPKTWGYRSVIEKGAYAESTVKCDAETGCVNAKYDKARSLMRRVLKSYIAG